MPNRDQPDPDRDPSFEEEREYKRRANWLEPERVAERHDEDDEDVVDRCPECDSIDLRYDQTTGAVDCVACGADVELS